MQNEKVQLELTQQEYEVISFYRSLSKEKKTLFLEFLESLSQLINDCSDE